MNFKIRCPNCQKVLTVQEQWGGMELDCPYCREAMLIPFYGKKSKKSAKSGNGGSVVQVVVRVVVILIVLGVLAVGSHYGYASYKKYTFLNPKDQAFIRDAETVQLPALFKGENFLYSGSTVTGFKLDSSEEAADSRVFKGMVTFQRKGREYHRPIRITRSIVDKTKLMTSMQLDWKYDEHNDYLQEDADIFFARWKQNNIPRTRAFDLSLRKTTPARDGVLCFRIAEKGEERNVYVRISDLNENGEIEITETERPMSRPDDIVKMILANRRLWEDEEWIYYGGKPQKAEAQETELQKDKAVFRAEVTFLLDGKTLTRPFRITVVRDGTNKNKFLHTYEVDFDYKSSSDYLKEDARYLYFSINRRISMLKEYSFEKAEVVQPGVLRFVLRKENQGSSGYRDGSYGGRRSYNNRDYLKIEVFFSSFTQKLPSGRTGSTLLYQVQDWDNPAVRAYLAGCFLHGKNSYKRDYMKGFNLACLAAEKGNAEGQYLLYECYKEGYYIGRNPSKAFYYCHQAAQNGHAKAQYLLGLMYFSGENECRKDVPRARYWLEKAASQGNRDAADFLEKIRRNEAASR